MEKIFENGGRRLTDGRRLDGYTISSPCEPNGSGELKIRQIYVAFIFRHNSEDKSDLVDLQSDPFHCWRHMHFIGLSNCNSHTCDKIEL